MIFITAFGESSGLRFVGFSVVEYLFKIAKLGRDPTGEAVAIERDVLRQFHQAPKLSRDGTY